MHQPARSYRSCSTASSSGGFTLIELMIVVAIIAILASIALSSYQSEVARSQIAEGIALAHGQKGSIVAYLANKGSYPSDNLASGIAMPASISGKYVDHVSVDHGLITATMRGAGLAAAGIQNKTISLSPIENAGSVEWRCKAGQVDPVPSRYLASSCR